MCLRKEAFFSDYRADQFRLVVGNYFVPGEEDHERLYFFDGRSRYVAAFNGPKEHSDKLGFHKMRTSIAPALNLMISDAVCIP